MLKTAGKGQFKFWIPLSRIFQYAVDVGMLSWKVIKLSLQCFAFKMKDCKEKLSHIWICLVFDCVLKIESRDQGLCWVRLCLFREANTSELCN